MKEFIETLQQISLGLFVNGSYGLMQGDYDVQNTLIVIFTIGSMYGTARLKRRYDGR
jgi:hypothetical protein